MKISFWSPSKGSGTVTCNLACISAMFSMMFRHKCIIIENHFQKNRINHLIQSRINQNILFEDTHYHHRYTGMEKILYKLSMNYDDVDEDLNLELVRLIEQVSKDILENHLFHISNDNRMEKQIFDYTINEHITTILKASEIFAEYIFIDTESSNNFCSQIVLHEADLVVVNLPQDKEALNHFFKNYNSIKSKCLFLISNYDKNSCLNLNKISQTYLIDKSSIAAIPFNNDYKEALSRGSLINFLIQNFNSNQNSDNNFFINEISKATRMLYNHLGFHIKKEIIKESICEKTLEEQGQNIGFMF